MDTTGTGQPEKKPEEKSSEPSPNQGNVPESSQAKKSSKVWIIVPIVIIAAFIIGFSFFYFSPLLTGQVIGSSQAGAGDTVSVLYTGRLENGSVFDTNIKEVADRAGISRPEFRPLDFEVGSGGVIEGFDNAVIGMGTGEKKTVTIQPAQGYGPIDRKKIVSSPRRTEFNRTDEIPYISEIPTDRFIQIFGIKRVNDIFVLPGTNNITYRVLNITNTTVQTTLNMKAGDVFKFPGSPWNTTIVNITHEKITLRHIPGEREIRTEFGRTAIDYGENKIAVTITPEVGARVPIPNGYGGSMFGTVVSVDDQNFTIDFNHELAGKTLVFDIQVVKVTKAKAGNNSNPGQP